jgi:hypothetical protein
MFPDTARKRSLSERRAYSRSNPLREEAAGRAHGGKALPAPGKQRAAKIFQDRAEQFCAPAISIFGTF